MINDLHLHLHAWSILHECANFCNIVCVVRNRDDTNEDLFVHSKSLKPMLINLVKAKKKLHLMDKEKVQFDVVKSKCNSSAWI